MKNWLKTQWKNNSGFRHAVSVAVMFGLTAAGVPAQFAQVIGPIISAVQG